MNYLKYSLFIVLLFVIPLGCTKIHKEKVIGIQPLGDFPEYLIDSVKQEIELIFNKKVVVLNKVALPQSAFVNVKSPRYRADSLIRFLKLNKPDSINYVLGLTVKDISVTKKDKNGKIKHPESKYRDFGIFGLGYLPGSSCIVSIFRLQNTSKENFMMRFKKICIHEIGHNMGLPHCKSSENCVMKDAAESIKTIDKVNLSFCEKCKAKIK